MVQHYLLYDNEICHKLLFTVYLNTYDSLNLIIITKFENDKIFNVHGTWKIIMRPLSRTQNTNGDP